jgi:hypothetical protein
MLSREVIFAPNVTYLFIFDFIRITTSNAHVLFDHKYWIVVLIMFRFLLSH